MDIRAVVGHCTVFSVGVAMKSKGKRTVWTVLIISFVILFLIAPPLIMAIGVLIQLRNRADMVTITVVLLLGTVLSLVYGVFMLPFLL